MHLCDPTKGLMGSSSIVAGCLGIGIGPAFRSKIMGENRVSVIFHGDCVPEEGIWHESLNFSAVKRLPVIYICENNLYAASSPIAERRVSNNIYEVAKAHGLHIDIVDGNDVFAVHKVASEAIKRARDGNGPQFIETRTYRWLGHVGPRDDIDVGLRDADELLFWKQRCPIMNLERKLVRDGIMTENEVLSMKEKVQNMVDIAERKAVLSSKPSPDTLLHHVYAREV